MPEHFILDLGKFTTASKDQIPSLVDAKHAELGPSAKSPCFVLQIAILTPSSRPTFHLFNLVSLQRVKHHYTFRFRPRKVSQYGTRRNSKPF